MADDTAKDILKRELEELVRAQTEDKALLRKDHRSLPDAPERMSRVHFRAAEITAHLNFANQMKGQPYRHGIRADCEYVYRDNWNLLKARFPLLA